MNGVFQDQYADAYDFVYGDKDYARETDAVCQLIGKFGDGTMRDIIDLGCGTGRHALLLADLGYHVTGVDRSAPMLEKARARAAEKPQAVLSFLEGDARTFSVGRTFDAALMMFHVIGYMPTNDDLLAALGAVHRHLRAGGLFMFDIWYGPAVVADPPGSRWKSIRSSEGTILRCVDSVHDPHSQCCDVTIRLLRTNGDQIIADTEETHRVRYFFPLEIDLALRMAGFRLEAVRTFPDINAAPGVSTWSSVVVAKRI